MFGLFNSTDANEMSVTDVADILSKNDADTIVIDVRTPEEFASEHVDGMVNYPLDTFFQHVNEIGQHKNVYCFCRSGGRSAQASVQLSQAGITAHNVRGGLIAWKNEGLPVVTS